MFIRLSKIKISDGFKAHKPSKEKMFEKIEYFMLNGKFKEKIILDKNNVLVDGYTTYLLAKQSGKKFIRAYRGGQQNG